MALIKGFDKHTAIKLCKILAEEELQTHYVIKINDDEFDYVVISQDEKDEDYPELEFKALSILEETPRIESVVLY